ncbi:MAG: hypothetical protein KJZ86_00620 [Caldilineaceae bacterium]|nr:hypothetical protein [Caldilineaceae bacterium]
MSTMTQELSSKQNRFLLQRLGFFIDPFQHLEASSDPHLGHYVVGLAQSRIARAEQPALIYAPAGGGKTAMRLHVLRSCWAGLAGIHPLPVTCIPQRKDVEDGLTDDAFWSYLGRSTAVSLLLGLSYRPERFLALEYADGEELIALWQALLPGPYARYWRILSDHLDPIPLVNRFDLTYQLPDKPDPSQLGYFCHRLHSSPRHPRLGRPQELWQTLHEIVLHRLGFGSIFLLLDGIDGFPTTFHRPRLAEKWLHPFIDRVDELAAHRVYVKAFLADEMCSLIEDDICPPVSVLRSRLEWTPELLAEMLHKRIEYASQGRIGSLDAHCGPGLRAIEEELVRRMESKPWPRRLLRYTRQVLAQWTMRTYPTSGRIIEEDLVSASRSLSS